MSVQDLEYELERMYLTSLQGVFAFDDKFIYNEDDTKTRIMITSEYPDESIPLKQPHIVVTGITYDYNLDNTMNRNFAREIFGNNNVRVGLQHMNIIPYSVTLACLGEFFESKDLANKLINYIGYEASEVFDGIGLHISRLSKGPSTPQSQFPEKIFQTPVAVTGNLHWIGTKTIDFDVETALRNIRSNLQIK